MSVTSAGSAAAAGGLHVRGSLRLILAFCQRMGQSLQVKQKCKQHTLHMPMGGQRGSLQDIMREQLSAYMYCVRSSTGVGVRDQIPPSFEALLAPEASPTFRVSSDQEIMVATIV